MTSKDRRLWIATEIYHPDEASTAHLLTRLAEGLASDGRVAVLCAQPSYEAAGRPAPRRESVNQVDVFRVVHPRLRRDRLAGRIANILMVAVRLFVEAIRQFRRGDVVLVVTNPPVLPFAIHAAARLRGVTVALLVHDVYPDAAILAGVLPRGGLVARSWRRASDWLFGRVDRIIVLGRDAAELIAARVHDGAARITVIPNWADVDEVHPGDPGTNPLLLSLGLETRFVVGYAGNMGRVQDVEALLAAARLLRSSAPEVHLLFVGSGWKAEMVARAAAESDSNVTLLGPRGRSEQELFLNACHVGVLALIPGMSGVGVPSRLYNLLAAGRPVLAAVDADSEPARVIREERVGLQTPPGDAVALARSIESLSRDPAFLHEAGLRAREAAEERYGFGCARAAYHGVLATLGWQSGDR